MKTMLLASDLTLEDAIAVCISHKATPDSALMEKIISKQLTSFKNLELIRDFYIHKINSPHQWVFRALINPLPYHFSWLIFFKLSEVGNSHWIVEYATKVVPRGVIYTYSQELLDFIGTYKWRKDFGQI